MFDISLKREDFISQYPPLNFLDKDEVKEIWKKDELHLYFHVPYCIHKCDFCYYKSYTSAHAQIPDEYIESLKTEVLLYSTMPEMQTKIVRSIYFGGGTPSLLSEKQIESILTCIRSSFKLAEECELCFEARPGPWTSDEKLKLLKSHGLTRLSIGCQSLDNEVLKINGRHQTDTVFYKTYERVRNAGIFSVNIDIMSGMVNQSLDSWLDTVKKVADLKPENLTIYKMEVYLNSKLYKSLRKGEIVLISDKEEINYAKRAYELLLNYGYQFADSFSFTLAPEYLHVQRYHTWKGADLLGIGVSSHSCCNGFVFQNELELTNYLNGIGQKKLAIQRAHKISAKEKMIQRVVFGIRKLKLCRSEFVDEFGIDIMEVFKDELNYLSESGFIAIDPKYIKTTFEGAIFSDDIVRIFYLPNHREMMIAHAHRS
jgi:oxygen-independent coproporphyrinogen III oxidase